eukprot:CAMPEP_0115076084 /NCGR_PEP_ID=MMETSP0227-20121206/16232_1 /TAXON_ID=89957 /ORGANISM="Polarella glacialis, Strain CCMP 1383" /LENGTH=64 /DNA_ID=CAMNT_0002463189 /DNA_START=74 /DNA_END=268 /DNA_ORIENTATION=+
MPHVFIAEKNIFTQVHKFDVPQRPTKQVQKRQRVGESLKYLMTLEDEATARTEVRSKRREALKQ